MIKRISSGLLCMKNMKRIAVISIFALALVNTACGAETSATIRPAHWAKPVQIKGAPNLHKVSDTLYRSAQPSTEGMRNLKAMGIETVVDLRSFHSDRDEIGDTGLAYEQIYVKAWHPEEEDAVRFLQIVTNPKHSPVIVHCQHGADRTGTMCVLYRVAVQGWSKEEALKEMTDGGFGFHGIWENLIQWINGLDIDRIKRKAEIR
ncbi:MAG: dual specificity protein phosphatase family protein [Thermodesulfobacteriota bacterium]